MYWHRNPWRRNPPIKDSEGNLLQEHQVRLVVKLLDEIKKEWHTREWFMDLLRGGEDPQVVRYILENVNWGYGFKHKINDSIRGALEEYLRELDLERYPEIELDLPLLRGFIETQETFSSDIAEMVDRIEGLLHNLALAERLGESRESIYGIKSQISSLNYHIRDAMDRAEEVAGKMAAAVGETTAGELPAMRLSAEILACEHCREEDFAWVDAEARVDVIDISNNPQIAQLQHQLRHSVMALHDGVANGRPKYQLFEIEDEIEDTHAAIERLRLRRNPYYW